jgi:hypothetical protein
VAVTSEPSDASEAPPDTDRGDGLPERERRILAFESRWRHAGAKEEAIRAEFDLPAARYYQLLNATLDLPAAVLFDPMLVRRLQRLRDDRTAARSARALGRSETTGPSRLPHQ